MTSLRAHDKTNRITRFPAYPPSSPKSITSSKLVAKSVDFFEKRVDTSVSLKEKGYAEEIRLRCAASVVGRHVRRGTSSCCRVASPLSEVQF